MRRLRTRDAERASGVLFPAETPAQLRRARYVGGIDEAGLGPLLGPLTLGYCVMRSEPARHELWSSLADVVSREPGDDATHVIVNDSKLVFTRTPRGERRLERTALCFLALARVHRPDAGSELIGGGPAELAGRHALADEPWGARLVATLPAWCGADDLASAQARLELALDAAQIELVDLGLRALAVRELNESFERTGSTARTHWDLTMPILLRLWREYAPAGLDLLVDRHGGRMRYRALLAESFPDAAVTIESEAPALSAYLVVKGGEHGPWMRIRFAERAESQSLPVALASCVAKYAREICMQAFNAHFCALDPELVPTAGYVSDGRRWLVEAARAIEHAGLSPEALVRQR